jgi:enoyl-CoA hydratase
MALAKHIIKDNIAILTMTSSVTNPINPELVTSLLSHMKKIENKASNLTGFILTSESKKFFSIGFDIPKLLKLKEKNFKKFYDDFNELCLKIFTLPVPTLSVITGHYVAAGCIIASCADYRYLADGNAKTGITAVKFGLQVPYLAKRIVHQRLEDRIAYEFLTMGELYDPTWAVGVGLVDKIIPQDQLIKKALKFLKGLETRQDLISIRTKRERSESVKQDYLSEKENDCEKFINTWFSDYVQEALHEAKSKF